MDMSFTSVLVDGSLSEPTVLLAVVVAALLLACLARGIVRFVLTKELLHATRWLFALPLAFIIGLATPLTVGVLIRLFMGTIFSPGVSLCLMPTHHFLRDWGPGLFGFGAGLYFGAVRIQESRRSSAA